ncbi:dihydrodipicolinate synthase family protein [Roseomonas aerophila]|uniref:Dihydrodipicolinate synthase family protein n=1 Tax=Teichococcus aerophilus TaxID=1224513 RepID=A0ABR7RHN3_9PROT|nr:dihydrodipicolinate synthase family protein [Pseudoroseomonas aerophila]MBC9205839.1 dihydrodipicolinate synthase family protein [Pseudoroseomonas aerophila]
MKLDNTAKGVFPIAPTPFHADGRVDEASVDRMTDFYLECGSTGMTVLGVMGEAPKLDGTESLALAKQFIKRASSIPVVVGVTAPGFAAMQTLARASMDAGAAGVMIAPPNTLRTDDQIVGYYRQAVEAIGSDIPFVVQDFPQTFSVVMTPGVLRRIIEENSSCVMVKHEDWPGLEKISALRKFEKEGMRRVSILCGNGGMFLDFEVERGADGAMTGYAFPDMLVDIVKLTQAGERDKAHDLFDAHLPLLRYEQQQGTTGLAVRKYVMARRGIIASDAQRKPAGSISATAKAEVEYLLSRVARVDPRAKLSPV